MKPQISIPINNIWVPLNSLPVVQQTEIRKKIAQVLEDAIKLQIKISSNSNR